MVLQEWLQRALLAARWLAPRPVQGVLEPRPEPMTVSVSAFSSVVSLVGLSGPYAVMLLAGTRQTGLNPSEQSLHPERNVDVIVTAIRLPWFGIVGPGAAIRLIEIGGQHILGSELYEQVREEKHEPDKDPKIIDLPHSKQDVWKDIDRGKHISKCASGNRPLEPGRHTRIPIEIPGKPGATM
ncbi:MAG: hypothetical protein AVDCRST_MAG43-2266 [uncultured Thermomicrobiales bacterium]|uniref:Uncharacterized protein n=1 Tax=uncultured Thermomicrobiales bacterium TaxID=1645740 RepID=A0A6J4V4J8_9BACT|nr:MAG: hypothetical protein AVDCRST_MAG43-2266 [uncultured Thermomicrobiales bacterium]